MSSISLTLRIGTEPTYIVAQTGGGLANAQTHALGQVSQLPSRGIDIASGVSGTQMTVSFHYHTRPDHNILDQPAVLTAKVHPGNRTYELFRGVTSGQAEFDPDTQSLQLTLRDKAPTADISFPPYKIGDPLRFPNAPLTNRDFAVPLLFGTNRDVPLTAIDDPENEDVVGSTPIRLIVAGHLIVSTVIDIVGDDGALIPGGPYTVAVDYDGQGGEFSYVSVIRDNYSENLYGARVIGYKQGGVAIDGLGDVLELLFAKYGKGYELDYNRISRAKPSLNRWAVGMRIDNQTTNTTLVDVISSRIGNQFPVAFGYLCGRFGWDSLVWPDLTTPPAACLVMGRNAFSTGEKFSVPDTAVVNNFKLNFEVSGRVGGNTRFVDVDEHNSPAASASMTRYGRSASREVNYPDHAVLNDDDNSQALALANEQIRAEGFRRWTATYLVEDFHLLDVPLLSVFRITDKRMGWVDKPGVLTAVEPLPSGSVKVTLAVEV